MTVTISTYAGVREAFRRKELRQALYDEGAVVMADCLLNLHGSEHRDRRRLENRLFRRSVFRYWEHEVLGPTVGESLQPYVVAGSGDLLPIGYRTTMNLTAFIAGVDRQTGTADETEHLYAIVKKFSEGATLVHSTRDRGEVVAEVMAAMETFDREFFRPSIEARRALAADVDEGRLDEAELPADVLMTLVRNQADLALTDEVIRREIAFYLQAGSHSTANAFTHAVDDLFTWAADHPTDFERVRNDRLFSQRCVHETMRLHPASPVSWRIPTETIHMADGTELPRGDLVILDIAAANSDVSLFGADAHEYDPHRVVPDRVAPWGHSFGGGMHACIGAELDGGLEAEVGRPDGEHLFGTVGVMVEAFLAAGGRPDPNHPPTLDPTSSRVHFSAFPVLFGGAPDG